MRVAEIGAESRLWRRRHGTGLVIVDYLQLIEPDDTRINREQQVARVTKGLKKLAKSLGIPVVVLAQLNREVEKRDDKRPRLSDLRESGSVEQDADQVLFVHRPDYYDPKDHPGEVELHLAKNRNGPRAIGPQALLIYWEAATMRFYESMSPDARRATESLRTVWDESQDIRLPAASDH
jgi:replicative DNA helicase